MKVLEFTYTKDNGDTSQRAVIEVAAPNTNLLGVDVSSLDGVELESLCAKLNELQTAYQEARQSLFVEYDIVHNIRNFKPANITNATAEYI